MADKRFNVVFSGKLVEGRQPRLVLAQLSSLINIEAEKVRELFKGGKGTVIYKDLGAQEAYRAQEDLREAGAVCSVQEISLPDPPEPLSGTMLSIDSSPAPARQQPFRQGTIVQAPLMPSPRNVQHQSGVGSLIGKVVLLVIIGGAGWWGYQKYLAPPTPAFQAYRHYAEQLVKGEYQKAADTSIDGAREHANSWIKMTAPSTMKVYGKEYNISPPSVSSIAGDVAWIKHKRKVERKANRGNGVVLEVEQTVCRIPPGVASAFCKWPVTFRHDVEVQFVEGAWKVAEFKEERLTPQQ